MRAGSWTAWLLPWFSIGVAEAGCPAWTTGRYIMILAKQPSIEDNKEASELIAHIEPTDDEFASSIEPIAEDEPIREGLAESSAD